MLIDITPIAEGKSKSFSFENKLKVKADLIAGIKINGDISKLGGDYTVKANATADIPFSCDKCLDPAAQSITFVIDEKFSNKESSLEEEEINLFTTNNLDLTECVLANLYLELPLQVLCKEDCKGLCRVCGVNQNETVCTCEEDNNDVDPRFAKLVGMFEPS